jgi:hypothetical protein
MKPFIDDNTRKVLMVVIPLQVRYKCSADLCYYHSLQLANVTNLLAVKLYSWVLWTGCAEQQQCGW